MLFKKYRDANGYYKTQWDEHNFRYTLGNVIRHETLQIERPVINDDNEDSSSLDTSASYSSSNQNDFELIIYESKIYVSKMQHNCYRVTTADLAKYMSEIYEYRSVTYDEVNYEEYQNLLAAKTLRIVQYGTTNYAIVFFDTETGGFRYQDDILQISMKCGSTEFNSYIDPTQPVSEQASKINSLTANEDDLFLDNQQVKSSPREIVYLKLLYYLKSLNYKCILVAHNNFNFYMPRFLRAIDNLGLLDEFQKRIEGFADTLLLFKNKYPNRSNGYQLTTLADDLIGIDCHNFHNAKDDVWLLEVLTEVTLNMNEVVSSFRPFSQCVYNFHKNQRIRNIINSYAPMGNTIKYFVKKRLAKADISYEDIIESYQNGGEQETISLLRGENDGIYTLIKSKKVINDILLYLRKLMYLC